MKIIDKLNRKRMRIITIGTLLLWIPIVFVGCAETYGRIHHSLDVSKMFETYEILDDYRYYFSGSDVKPDGIIGIHKSYTLDSSLWKPVDITSEQLKSWIEIITNYHGVTYTNNGALILDPAGKQIGVWYSQWGAGIIKMEDDNRIMVTTPDKTMKKLRFFHTGDLDND